MKSIDAIYYNEELKKRYLDEKGKYTITNNYIDVQFRKSSEMEYEIDKDVSNWTVYEIIEYYKLLNITSLEVLVCLNSILSQYCQFCLENNLVIDNQNHFLECTKDVLSNCINKAILEKKIISKETVSKWVDELPNPKDQFILLGLFEFGKSKDYKDIVNARLDNLDEKNKKLQLSDRKVNVSNKLINIMHNCQGENTYYSISGLGIKVMPLIDYGFVVKSYPNQNMDLSDYHGEVENDFNEYFYEDSNPDGVGIYVRAYHDGTFYAEATDWTGNHSKDIQFIHELQHMFKDFNAKKDWVI